MTRTPHPTDRLQPDAAMSLTHDTGQPLVATIHRVARVHGVPHLFAVAVPPSRGHVASELEEALRRLDAIAREQGMAGSMIHQSVFLADATQEASCRSIVEDFYGPHCPATSYIPQNPASGAQVAVEVWGMGRDNEPVEIERLSPQLVRVSREGISWVFCAQVVPRDAHSGAFNQSMSALSKMRALLGRAGVGFEQIVRTWYYQGGITEPEADTQRYKELNRARTDFFEGVQFLADCRPPGCPAAGVFPASTGIGAEGWSVLLGGIALETARSDVLATPLENPRQTSAFAYGTHYSPKSPKFSRALAVCAEDNALIFISGTASITDSESRHIGNPAAQTRETLENILALISEANLRRHGMPGLGATLDDLLMARVYVKRPEDYAVIRAVCEERLRGVPTLFTIAGVCRPELLVEIEGIALAELR